MTYANDQKYLLNLYNKYNLEIKKTKGMYIYTNQGKYLDMFSSLSTNSLGHRNYKILWAILFQLRKYLHLSNCFVSKPVVKLAKLLVETSFASKVFFTNSGTEANEAALKLVKIYGNQTNKTKVISLVNSYHGRTCGSLSLTGQENKRNKFEPLLNNIEYIEKNNFVALNKVINESTLAVFLELIQGEAGVQPLTKEYIEELVKLREKYGFLIVVDEVQTGLMRTGLLYAYLDYNFKPDIMTLAKSLGGGLPLGAMLVSSKLEDLMKIGDHGSTFGGNPLACSSGYQVLKKVSKFKTYHHVNLMSDYLFYNLYKLSQKYPHFIKEIRGKGLMIGIEIARDIDLIKEELFKSKILINITNQTTIRLLPALIIKKKEIDIFIQELARAFDSIEVLNGS